MRIDTAYNLLYDIVLIVLLLFAGCMMLRSVKRKRITDRIISVNMIGTMIICVIAVLANKLEESYLCDVALIYAMISFLAVLMLTSMNTPAKSRRKKFTSHLKPQNTQRKGDHK